MVTTSSPRSAETGGLAESLRSWFYARRPLAFLVWIRRYLIVVSSSPSATAKPSHAIGASTPSEYLCTRIVGDNATVTCLPTPGVLWIKHWWRYFLWRKFFVRGRARAGCFEAAACSAAVGVGQAPIKLYSRAGNRSLFLSERQRVMRLVEFPQSPVENQQIMTLWFDQAEMSAVSVRAKQGAAWSWHVELDLRPEEMRSAHRTATCHVLGSPKEH